MRIISLLVILIILIIGVSFAVLNAQLVSINYYLGTNKLPLSLLLVIVLGIGAIIGWISGLFLWLRLKSDNIRLSHRVKILEKETHMARSQSQSNESQ